MSLLKDYDWLKDKLSTGTYKSIGDELGLSWCTIRNYAIAMGLESDYNKLSPEALAFLNNKELMEEEYWNNDLNGILKKYGINKTSFYKYLKKHDIAYGKEQISDHAKRCLTNKAWCEEQYSQKSSITIAKELGVTDCTVLSYLKNTTSKSQETKPLMQCLINC